MNIVLIGMRGSGKSTIAKLIGKKLRKKVIDSDREIEQSLGMKISEIVDKFGWNYFREKEKEQIIQISSEYKDSVIATGGGVVLNGISIGLLKQDGLVVFLNTPLRILSERLESDDSRPPLTKKDSHFETKDIWSKRKKLYFNSADIVYNKKEREITAQDALNIIELINNYDCNTDRRER